MSGAFITEVGICGKIPSRGDFLAQGLAADFVDGWSEWLQAVLAVSREQLTTAWLETYLTSPIWHFALSAGVCGKAPMLGCLMPSVDKVGRHFPFTLACAMACNPVQARFEGNWADILQQQALLTLEDEFNFPQWQAALKQLQILWPEQPGVCSAPMPAAQGRPAWAIVTDQPLDSAMLLHHSYQQQFGRYCLWWTEGSEYVPQCTLISSGLPQVSQYAAMLDGDWQRRHWQQAHINSGGTDKQ
ncbi:MAG: type VI secretion system-associated protein TagF [Rheinheimera sp.]|nr:type VI secretion system-associated protein TagF [Rheinheimera sp.]